MMKNLNRRIFVELRLVLVLILTLTGFLSIGGAVLAQEVEKPGPDASIVERVKYYGIPILKGGRDQISSLPEEMCSTDGTIEVYVDAEDIEATTTSIIWTIYTGSELSGDYVEHPDWVSSIGTAPNNGVSFDPNIITEEFYGDPVVFSYTQYDGVGECCGNYDYVRVYKTPQVYDFAQSAVICSGSQTTITLPTSESDMFYNLYYEGSKLSPYPTAGTGSSITFNVSSAGSYTVKAFNESTEAASTCWVWMDNEAVVTVNSLPVVSASNDGPGCEGSTINLSGGSDGMVSYTWSGPNGFSSTEQNPEITNITLSGAGTYTLNIVDGNGCENSTTTDIVVNSNPTITASSNSPICEGSPINLTSTPAGGSGVYASYSWTGPNTFNSQNATIATSTLIDAGDYYVTVTDNNGCSSSGTDMTTVVVTERPTASLSYNNPVCLNTDLVLTATGSGGSGTYVNYVWTKDGVVISGESGSTLTITSATLTDAATYGVSIEDDSGCISDETTIPVTINSLPVVTAGNDGPVCEGTTINLSGGTAGMVSYTWSGPDGFSSTEQNPEITNITLSGAGTYTLNIVDGNGCGNSTTTDIVVNSNPTITASSNSPICEGSTINLTSTPVGGSGVYSSFSWTGPNNFSVQNATIATSVLSDAGDYYVSVTDNNGCSSSGTDMTTVVVTVRPTASLSFNNPVCLNTDLILTATGSGGSGTYVNYVWTKDGVVISGESASTLTISSATITDAATYGVSIEDDSGCISDETTIPVTINSLPVVTAGNDGPVCEGATINLSGGTAGMVSYTWSGPDGFSSAEQNPGITNITLSGAGTYTLNIVDGNGCENSTTTDVVVNSNPTITASSNSPVCAGSSIDLTSSPTGGSGVYSSFSWTGPNNFSVQNATIATSTLSDAGDYYVTVTDNNGCSSSGSDMTTVVVTERPTASLSYNSPVCLNTDLILTATGSGGSGTYVNYVWTKDGVVISGESGSTLTITSATLTDAATYGVSIEDNSGCISDETTIPVTINSLPVVSATNDGPVCEGATINLSGGSNGMTSYTWSGPGGFSSTEQNPEITNITLAGAGTYTLNITDGNGCENSTTTEVVINANPTITASSNSPVCVGSSINLTSTPSGGSGVYSTFSWSGPNNFSTQDATIATSVLSDAGDYYVTVTDNNGCSSLGTDLTTVVVTERPTASLSYNNPVCLNTDLVLTALGSGGSGNYVNYVWTKDGVVISGENSNILTITSATLTDAATYGVSIEDESGCISDETTIVVTINSLPVVSAGNDGPVCEGSTINLTGGSDGMTSYTWSGPDGFSSTEQNTAITNISLSGAGTYTLYIVDGNGCENSITTEVVINPNPTITAASNSPVCEGSTINLSSTPAGGSGVYTSFSWTGPNTFSTKDATIATSTSSDAGDYYVTVTDNNGCSSSGTDMTTVVVAELPTVSLSYNDKVCLNEDLILTATASGGSGNYVNYVWTKEGVVISGENASTLTINSAALSDAGTYGVSVEDNIGCGSSETTILVNIYDLPVVTVGNDGPVCEGKTINLFGGSDGMISYNWSGPEGFTSSIQNPTLSDIPSSGAGTYTLLIEDANGCQNTASTDIEVNRLNASIEVSAPTAGITKFCAATEVTFTAVATEGSGDYTYDFHVVNSITGDQSVQNTSSDTYSNDELKNGDQVYVIILDNTSLCTESSTDITIEIVTNPAPDLFITSAGGNVICSTDNVEFSAEPGFERYIFTKNGTDVLQDGISNLYSSDALINGDVISVEAFAGSCSGPSSDITITVYDLPEIDEFKEDDDKSIVCENETVNFTVNATGTGTLKYQFLVDGNIEQAISTTNTFSYYSTNDFTVTAQVFNDNNCQVTSDPIDITISKPVATLSADPTTICNQHDVNFTATGGVDYEFFVTSSSVETSMQGPGSENTYTTPDLENNDIVRVEVKNEYGCTASASSLPIIVNPIPNVSVSSTDDDNTICSGEEVTFKISGGNTFEWYLNGTLILGENNSTYVTTTLADGDIVTGRGIYGSTGCYSESSIPAITVNSLPIATLNVTPSLPIVEGTQLTFTAGGGDSYEFFVNATSMQGPEGANIYTSNALGNNDDVSVKVIADATGCYSVVSTTVEVFDGITSLEVLTNDKDKAYCAGDGGLSVYLGGTPQNGVTYTLVQVSDNASYGSPIEYDGSIPVRWDGVPGTEEYKVVGSYGAVVGSDVEMSNHVTITENPLPSTSFNMDPTGEVTGCNGGAGYDITLDGSEIGIDYVLYLNGVEINKISGTGTSIDFGVQTVIGIYTIEAVNIMTECSALFTETFEIKDDGSNQAFNVYVVGKTDPTDGRYCNIDSPTGIEIELDGSLGSDVSYKLFLGDVDTGISVAGTGGVISFGTVLTEGNYTVRVESATGCQYPMNGNVIVSAVDLPNKYNIVATNSGHYCEDESGVTISLDNQQENIQYDLYQDGTLVETKIGTDAAGTPLVFDGIYSAGTYSIEATVSDVGCSIAMNNTVEVIVDVLPTVFDLTSDGDYCSGSSTYIHMAGSESDVEYRWHNLDDNTYGDALTGTGGVLDVEISNAGNYEIVAQRTDGLTGCSSVMNGTFLITEKPLPDATTIISETYTGTGCDDGSIVTIILSESGVEYTLVKKVDSDYYDAGLPSIIGDGNDISFDPIVDKDNAEYTALANLDGCTVYLNNSVFIDITGVVSKQIVTGSGEICNGDPGVVFGLDDTEAGVSYELWLADSEGSSTGEIKETIIGDGSAISFSAVGEEGEYFVMGVSSNCTLEMANRVVLNVNPLPEAYKMIGSGEYCDVNEGALISLDNSEEGVSYMLQFDDGSGLRNALSSAAVGGALTDTIDFGRFTEIGSYTVIATTDKGCTSSMNGVVITNLSTTPIDQTVEYDSNTYCQDSEGVELRLTDHEGEVVYQVIDESTNSVIGEVVDEDPSGSGELSLGTYSEGTYSFVASRGGDACEININGGSTVTLTMIPLPTEHIVYADETNVCGSEGTNVGIEDSEAGREYRIEDSTGTILETITSEAGEAITWSVSDIGTSEIYEIYAIADGGCDLSMGSIEIEFKEAPTIPEYEISNTTYCEGENGISITIHNSELEVGYQLKDIDGKTHGYEDGNGGDISFDNIEEGEYNIVARNNNTGCESYTLDNFVISMNPSPTLHNVFAENEIVCGSEGTNVGLEDSEPGREYRIEDSTGAIQETITSEAGEEITWLVSDIGTSEVYEIIAIDDLGCDLSMGTVSIKTLSGPSEFNIVIDNDGTYCESDGGVAIGVENSEANVYYWLVDVNDITTALGVLYGNGTEETNYFDGLYPEGSYYVIAKSSASECDLQNETEIVITTSASPEEHDVKTDSENVCESESARIYLDGFEVGRDYMLVNSSDSQEGGIITGEEGGEVSWEIPYSGGTEELYEVYALAEGSCDLSMGIVQIYYLPAPSEFTILDYNDKYCNGEDGVTFGIQNPTAEVYYWLVYEDNHDQPLDVIYGSGEIIDEYFDGFYTEGTYNIIAKSVSQSCDRSLSSGAIEITGVDGPDTENRLVDCTNDNEEINYEGCVVDDALCIDVAEEGVDYYLYKEEDLENYIDVINVTTDQIGNSVCFNPIEEEGNYIIIAQSTDAPYCSNRFNESYYFDHKDYGELIAVDDIFNVETNALSDTFNVRANDQLIYIDDLDEPQSTPYPNDLLGEFDGDNFIDKYFEDFGSETNLTFYLIDEDNQQVDSISDSFVGIFKFDDNGLGWLSYKKTPGFYGKYQIRYVIENTEFEDRIDTAYITVYVGNESVDDNRSFLIPNAFSPNGDNYNQYFKISPEEGGLNATKSKLEVFNRWGVLVYRSKGVTYGDDENWWDGTSTTSNMVSIGSDLPNGTYFYVFTVEINEGESVTKKEYSGYIELRR